MRDSYYSKNYSARHALANRNANSETNLIERKIEHLQAEFSKTQPFNDTRWNSSVVQVLFKNETFARKYRYKIEKFLKELLEEDEEFIVFHPPHSNGEKEFEDYPQTFKIDLSKNEIFDNTKSTEKIPVYSSTFEDTLNDDEVQIIENPEEEKLPQMTCFNCLGDHHMRNCPEKIDRNRINANKKEIFMGNTVRYHTEEQGNSLVPGKVSVELRNALGLKSDQLPLFIYNMRIIGYPPGWMNEAILEDSGLSLYDVDGKAITDGKPLPLSEKRTLYDGTKFIDYAGFNSPVPGGLSDEWKALKMPPLQAHQQLKEALNSPNIIMSNNKMYKRKQFPSASDVESKKSKNVKENNYNTKSEQASRQNIRSPRQMESDFSYITPENKPNKRQSMSISISPGTPILAQGNPYQKLPAADKFAQGITEHLPFENLPDAVGTFEKMRGIISCVQKKMNNLQNS